MKILSVDQMTRIDQLTSEQFGISSLILMENAASSSCGRWKETFQETFGSRESPSSVERGTTAVTDLCWRDCWTSMATEWRFTSWGRPGRSQEMHRSTWRLF